MLSMRVGKLGKQFKDANKAGATWVVVVGPDDKAQGHVLLKNLGDGTQQSVSVEQAIQIVLDE